jgi:glycosyltransferase involved in cell wall biosynthesis
MSNLVSIVVTHRNYSTFLEGALRSVLAQTHTNWECVVVDDASDDEHRTRAAAIVAKLNDARVSFLRLNENVGQVPTFFAGMDVTRGEFCCLLDPDDRYHPTFLERMLAVHLNETVFCPLASSDQRLVRENGEPITGIYSQLRLRMLEGDEIPERTADQLLYFPARESGWHWASTSSLMFRRPALSLLRPHKKLSYPGAADSYLANGAHALGGTLRLTCPLVDRTVHSSNAFLTDLVFSSLQPKRREGRAEFGYQARMDSREAIVANGGAHYLARGRSGRRGLFRRLGNSIAKRARRLAGMPPKRGVAT